MSDDPRVSVLMPVRNGGAHLDDAMASLLEQSFPAFEVVGVDDGSVDDTAHRLRAWTQKDARVRAVSIPAAGIVVALETARTIARGGYLARMDADDIAEPGRLAAQVDLLDGDPSLAGCGCGVEYFPRARVRDGARRYEAWLNAATSPEAVARSVWVECPLAHPTFFLRACAVEAVGGYADRGWPEDYDLVLRLHLAGHRLTNVPRVLHRWREGEGRLSRRSPRYSADAFLRCKVHYLRLGPLASDRPVVVWGAGPVGKTMARALIEAGTRVAAFVELDPRKIGQEIHGAHVVDTAAALEMRGPLHLAAVGQKGARSPIEAVLEGGGFRPGEDFLAIA